MIILSVLCLFLVCGLNLVFMDEFLICVVIFLEGIFGVVVIGMVCFNLILDVLEMIKFMFFCFDNCFFLMFFKFLLFEVVCFNFFRVGFVFCV